MSSSSRSKGLKNDRLLDQRPAHDGRWAGFRHLTTWSTKLKALLRTRSRLQYTHKAPSGSIPTPILKCYNLAFLLENDLQPQFYLNSFGFQRCLRDQTSPRYSGCKRLGLMPDLGTINFGSGHINCSHKTLGHCDAILRNDCSESCVHRWLVK